MLAFDDEGNEISLAPAKETRSEPVTQTAHQGLDPEKRALLDTIAGGESPGYNAMYTGKGSVRRFTDFSDHPRSGDRISKGPNAGQTSSAAGPPFTPSSCMLLPHRNCGFLGYAPPKFLPLGGRGA